MKKKTLIIIGADVSGLASAKYALEAGITPIILEKRAEIGGVWNPSFGYTWESMTTNLSKHSCKFFDFDWSEDASIFPNTQEMHHYLLSYAQKFDLLSHTIFNANVIGMTKRGDKWIVQYEALDGSRISIEGDFAIIASGIFSSPNIPSIEGMKYDEEFVIHSSLYKEGSKFKDKKCLVLGGSLTAAELASDLSRHAAVTHHYFNEPFWVLKRWLDYKQDSSIPMDLLFYNRNFYKTVLTPPDARFAPKNKYMSTLCGEQQQIESLRIGEDLFTKPVKIVISDNYISQAQNGKIIPRLGKIVKLEGNRVYFSDGKIEEYDHIILATGYKIDLDFLGSEIKEKAQYDANDTLQPLVLFKECMHPEIKNLFFIGMYKGPYFAVIESQAKFAISTFTEKTIPLFEDEVLSDMAEEKRIRDMRPKMQFPHPDYVRFCDEILRISGSFIDIEKLKATNPEKYGDFLSSVSLPADFSKCSVEDYIERGRAVVEQSVRSKDSIDKQSLEKNL